MVTNSAPGDSICRIRRAYLVPFNKPAALKTSSYPATSLLLKDPQNQIIAHELVCAPLALSPRGRVARDARSDERISATRFGGNLYDSRVERKSQRRRF